MLKPQHDLNLTCDLKIDKVLHNLQTEYKLNTKLES